MGFRSGVVLREEVDDADVVGEGGGMGAGEGGEGGHVGARDGEGTEEGFGEGGGGEAEVGPEEEVGRCVEAPFAGVFEGGSGWGLMSAAIRVEWSRVGKGR